MLIFEAERLRKVYRGSRSGVVALDDITLRIESGSLTLLAGPSGSGKTTLLALLGGLERPTSGRIAFEGVDLFQCSGAELARVRRRMGFVFQDFALIPNLSAVENVAYPLIPRGVPRRERIRRSRELLARFGLEARADAKAQELSGGEQQRVAIARALAGGPDVVLADEPTSNLDADTAGLLLAALGELRSEGKTVVIASHDPRVATAATATLELNGGRLTG